MIGGNVIDKPLRLSGLTVEEFRNGRWVLTKNTRVARVMMIVLAFGLALSARAQNPLTEIPAGDEGMVTGPEVGERIPDFAGLNQNATLVGFDDIKGPNGAVVLFHRSADW